MFGLLTRSLSESIIIPCLIQLLDKEERTDERTLFYLWPLLVCASPSKPFICMQNLNLPIGSSITTVGIHGSVFFPCSLPRRMFSTKEYYYYSIVEKAPGQVWDWKRCQFLAWKNDCQKCISENRLNISRHSLTTKWILHKQVVFLLGNYLFYLYLIVLIVHRRESVSDGIHFRTSQEPFLAMKIFWISPESLIPGINVSISSEWYLNASSHIYLPTSALPNLIIASY